MQQLPQYRPVVPPIHPSHSDCKLYVTKLMKTYVDGRLEIIS